MNEVKPISAEVQIFTREKSSHAFEVLSLTMPHGRHWNATSDSQHGGFDLFNPTDQDLLSISKAALGEIVRRHPELGDTLGAFTDTVHDALREPAPSTDGAATPTEPVAETPGANRAGEALTDDLRSQIRDGATEESSRG